MRILDLRVWEKCFVRGTARSGHADCDSYNSITSSSMLAGMVLARRGRGLIEPSWPRFDRGLKPVRKSQLS
ncbi:hypothetical protein AXF42_Ash014390 [Apostasia shenzhenica]|uniref:Uncharacterized protein n=1 Tax=Apostasia shenzhenica TaxID=1088818 RepID=A0A2I0B0Z3_9ASPA|nr:hypothetical protein AXF42_Ash014390 [Apostasia shenzhenica]